MIIMCLNIAASLLQALDKQQESLLHFREAVKLAPWNFEAQKGTYINTVLDKHLIQSFVLTWDLLGRRFAYQISRGKVNKNGS